MEISVPNFHSTFLSIKWFKSKFHPDMLHSSRNTIIKILKVGLMFKEDSLQIEDNLQIEDILNKKKTKTQYLNLFTGQNIFTISTIGICFAILPLKTSNTFRRNCFCSMFWIGAGVSIPILYNVLTPKTIQPLLNIMSEYTILARKCLASIKQQSLYTKSCHKVSLSALNSLFIQQQQDICLTFQHYNSVLESIFLNLSTTSLWEVPIEDNQIKISDNLIKLHHLFLILQSTFLKNVALAHLTPSSRIIHSQNNNEKIYWIHSNIFPFLYELISNYHIILNNTYKAWKESNITKDIVISTLPRISHEPWQYSEVHNNVITLSSELRTALYKCNDIDKFLEACWNAKSKFSPPIFEEDLIKLKENLMKCFNTLDTINIQLKKIHVAEMKLLEQAVQKLHLPAVEEEEIDLPNTKIVSENTEVDIQDQVFYYEKNDDDNINYKAEDYLTVPGKKEIDVTNIVLNELKIVLTKKEDEMRQRETIALENTMPEYKGKLPDFPKQIIINNFDKNYNISELNNNGDNNYRVDTILLENDIEHNTNNGHKNTYNANNLNMRKNKNNISNDFTLGSCEVEASNIERKYKNDFKKNESSENSESSEDEIFTNNCKTTILLEDIRKNRITRKKCFPSTSNSYNNVNNKSILNENKSNNLSNELDESLKPVEYTFGTGMAMASLLQIKKQNNENQLIPTNSEETFIGDGEVSDDSGNET